MLQFGIMGRKMRVGNYQKVHCFEKYFIFKSGGTELKLVKINKEGPWKGLL